MGVCVSGDGGELFEQDVLTQCVQGDILPHIQTDGAHLRTHTHTYLSQVQEDERPRFNPAPVNLNTNVVAPH